MNPVEPNRFKMHDIFDSTSGVELEDRRWAKWFQLPWSEFFRSVVLDSEQTNAAAQYSHTQ
jgi:hypothetical protein